MEKKQKKWIVIGVVAFVLLAVGLVGLYLHFRETPTNGAKHITVSVTHGDGMVKTFEYDTDAQYLGPFLVEQKLIQEKDGTYILKVDGETADWDANQSYWAIYEGDTYASVGIDEMVVKDGASYGLVYTIG